jgi:hypothetical protein
MDVIILPKVLPSDFNLEAINRRLQALPLFREEQRTRMSSTSETLEVMVYFEWMNKGKQNITKAGEEICLMKVYVSNSNGKIL